MALTKVRGNGLGTLGDGTANDSSIIFDGNAQDFHIGLDDSADSLTIGLGSTLGTTSHMVFDSTGAITKPLQPAFLAKLNGQQSNLTNDGNLQTVEFDYEPFDQNADFNTSNYTFTAPVTGKYFFSVQLFLETIDTGATYYSLRLVTSNRTYENAFDPNFSADLERYTVQMSVLADMDASDTALMRILQVSGTSQTDINADNSTFSGYLAC